MFPVDALRRGSHSKARNMRFPGYSSASSFNDESALCHLVSRVAFTVFVFPRLFLSHISKKTPAFAFCPVRSLSARLCAKIRPVPATITREISKWFKLYTAAGPLKSV